MITKIYGFKTGEFGDDVAGTAIAQVGGIWRTVAGHMSSSVSFLKGDLGITDWGHGKRIQKGYDEMFPGGWNAEWVEDPDSHPVLGPLCG
jgi:hypothetical protein